MRARLVGFGVIEIEGTRYEHDVVIDRGVVSNGHDPVPGLLHSGAAPGRLPTRGAVEPAVGS